MADDNYSRTEKINKERAATQQNRNKTRNSGKGSSFITRKTMSGNLKFK